MISLRQVLTFLRRSKVIVGIGLVAACVVSTTFWSQVPPSYNAMSSIVLVAPNQMPVVQSSNQAEYQNPLLSFDPGLSTTATILVEKLNSTAAQDELGVTSSSGTELVVTDASQQSSNDFQVVRPFVYVEASADNETEAETLASKTVAKLRADLEAEQVRVGAPRDQLIQVVDVVAPTQAVTSQGARIASAVGGGAASLMVAAAFALYRGRDRLRRQENLENVPAAPQSSDRHELEKSNFDSPTRRIQR